MDMLLVFNCTFLLIYETFMKKSNLNTVFFLNFCASKKFDIYKVKVIRDILFLIRLNKFKIMSYSKMGNVIEEFRYF